MLKFIVLLILLNVNLFATEMTDSSLAPIKYFNLSESNKITINKNVILEYPNEFQAKFYEPIKSFEAILKIISSSNGVKKILLNKLSEEENNLKLHESYSIEINKSEIIISSKSDLGLLHGLTTLEHLLIKNNGRIGIGKIFDFPATKDRILQFSLWSSSIDDYKEIIKLARFQHYNSILLTIPVSVQLNSFKEFKLYKNAISLENFKLLVNYIKVNGMEVIPNIQLLSHQDMFLKDSFVRLMFNHDTYDPRKAEIYKSIIFPVIDELLELTNASKFHIGHDEVYGYSKNHNVNQLPPELFLKDVLILNDYLQKKNIEVWMWGDMLIKSDEFPIMEDRQYYFRGNGGYYKLRDKIPKNIVICDWHYRGNQEDFPTSLVFSNNGHKVLGAVWKIKSTKVNFTEYINNKVDNGQGMIATTWYSLDNNKNLIKEIIEDSGRIFWSGK
jgi:hypothetical protein